MADRWAHLKTAGENAFVKSPKTYKHLKQDLQTSWMDLKKILTNSKPFSLKLVSDEHSCSLAILRKHEVTNGDNSSLVVKVQGDRPCPHDSTDGDPFMKFPSLHRVMGVIYTFAFSEDSLTAGIPSNCVLIPKDILSKSSSTVTMETKDLHVRMGFAYTPEEGLLLKEVNKNQDRP